MPESIFDTEGLWIEINIKPQMIESRGYDLRGSLRAMEHAIIRCVSLFLLCDKGDTRGLSHPSYPPFGRPVIFLCDGYEGGVGFTQRGFEVIEECLRTTIQLISECPCEEGCPSCVQDPQCGSGNEPLDKEGAIFLLERYLGA